MSLTYGTKLGAYEITGQIGAGGMGEVYRATDTRLDREVAIKTLPASLIDDANRLARFEREAKLLASVNHAHIASIYGLDEHEGTPYLAMELVEGESLHEKLETGHLTVENALRLARQIAEALEAAHEKGVIHRDLKPANVMVTRDGVAKVLDFGLAKALTVDTNTLTARGIAGELTREGAIQGTPGYMSPEQVRGEVVDARTDIWAFGCLLFEMLSGQPAFASGTLTETLARVLEREPALERLPGNTPLLIRRLIRRCLEKDAHRRLHHIADARIEIEESLNGTPDEMESAHPAKRPLRLVSAGFFGAGALVATAALLAWLTPTDDQEESAAPIRFSIGPVAAPQPDFFSSYVAVSADGSRIAYVSGGGTILEGPTGELDARAIANGYDLFYRNDGEWLAFGDGATMWKVPVAGGAPEEITRFEPRFLGGTWLDDTIVFANNQGLFRVSSEGGSPEPLVRPDDGITYAWPSFVSGATLILFTMIPADDVGAAQVACLDLNSLVVTPVGRGTAPRYLRDGFLVYAAGDGLETIGFDPDTCETNGAPVAVPGVGLVIDGAYASADFALSHTGTLVTMSRTETSTRTTKRLIWVDPVTGAEQATTMSASGNIFPRISPDGTRVAIDQNVSGDRDIWVYDLEDGSGINVSANPGEDLWPVWSSDGQRIYFGSARSSTVAWSQIYSRRADGSGPTRLLIDDPLVRLPWWVSVTGQVLVFNGVRQRSDIGVVNESESQDAEWILANPRYSEQNASLSSDGDLILYESEESGERSQVYIRPYPNVDDGRLQVSVGGGNQPRWGPEIDGKRQVYYQAPNGDMMVAEANLASEPPSIDSRRLLFPNRGYAEVGDGGFQWNYDISPLDGRFLMVRGGETDQTDEAIFTVTVNWDEELKRLVRDE